MSYVNPAELAPQDDSQDAGAERREIALYLVIEYGDGRVSEYRCNADDAWVFGNDAYEHCGSVGESLSGNEGVYYRRDAVAA